jgi:hypothetical protein
MPLTKLFPLVPEYVEGRTENIATCRHENQLVACLAGLVLGSFVAAVY